MDTIWITNGKQHRWEVADGGDDRLVQITSERDDLTIIEQEHSIQIKAVIPGFSHGTDIVTVYKPSTAFGRPEEAKVNWSALGSVTANIVGVMMKALQIAVELTNKLNDKSTEVDNGFIQMKNLG